MLEEHTVELYCGSTKPFSSIASFLGYRTTTFDPNPEYQADVIAAAAEVDPAWFPSAPTMVWMAPPSEGFDDKAGWDWSNFSPVTPGANLAEDGLRHCLNLAYQMKAKWWFLEVPKSCLRKLPIVAGFNRGYPSRNRYTLKPKDFGSASKTDIDIYTNAFWWVPLSQSDGENTAPANSHSGDDRRAPPSVYLDMLNQYDAYLRNKGER
jgi:hypothetical protein